MINIPKDNTYYVLNLYDDNRENTFRYCINQSNKNAISKIIFLVDGTIKILSCLPKIKRPVIIDGTQITNYTELPLITIDFDNNHGLILEKNSDYSQIFGISLINLKNYSLIIKSSNNKLSNNRFSSVLIYKSKYNIINDNFVGIINENNGIYIKSSHDNIVNNNICSGNNKNGIKIKNSNNNIIQKNIVGFTTKLRNDTFTNKLNGILIKGSCNNTKILENICSGNDLNGIEVEDNISDLLLLDNVNFSNLKDGLLINTKCNTNNLIIEKGAYSANDDNGIHLTGSSDNITIRSVICGLDIDGKDKLPNGKNGLLIDENSNNNIIGNNYNSYFYRNTFSGNKNNGVHITDNANNNLVNLSYIGLSVNGEDKNYGNELNGVLLDKNTYHNFIGTKTDQVVINNFIADNKEYGVNITDQSYCNKIFNNIFNSTIEDELAENILGAISNTSSKKNCIKDNIIDETPSVSQNITFYFYESPTIDGQNGVISPVDENIIMSIPYKTNWDGQRYLLSTYSTDNNGSRTYEPLKLQNINELSFIIDLSQQQFGPNDHCNFNCYLVSTTSATLPNKNLPPINNTQFVSTSNYYDAAGADGGRFGVEFDIFETNSGNQNNSINFHQHTGHFTTSLLSNINPVNTQSITYSSSTNFETEPTNSSVGAPDTKYRTIFPQGNISVDVKFSNPQITDQTTISFNDTILWNSKWLVGGTWEQWNLQPPQPNTEPASVIGTLVPFSNVTDSLGIKTATPNDQLKLEVINNANSEGFWLFIGMNPFYSPPTSSYNGNHIGTNSPNSSGGNININNFRYTTW